MTLSSTLVISAVLITAAVFLLVSYLVRWHLRGPAVSSREWEEAILLYVVGGPQVDPFTRAVTGKRISESEVLRDMSDRSLNLRALAEALVAGGFFERQMEAEETLEGAHERLVARGAAARMVPPDGSPPGSLPPQHWVVLTPKGAREALEVWRRERAKLPEAARA